MESTKPYNMLPFLIKGNSIDFLLYLKPEATCVLKCCSSFLNACVLQNIDHHLVFQKVQDTVSEIECIPSRPVVLPALMNIGHKGVSEPGIEPNTIPAFYKAVEHGASVIELDVQVCKSGELVVFHDLFLPNGHLISDWTYNQLQQTLPSICTLPQVLTEFYVPGIHLYFDLKGRNVLEPLWNILEHHLRCTAWSVDQWIISAFNHSYLAQIQIKRKQSELLSTIRTSASFDSIPIQLAKEFEELGVSFVSTTFGMCSPEFLEDARNRNLGVIVWTINTPTIMTRLIKMGVDGIVTDKPQLLTRLSRTIRREPLGHSLADLASDFEAIQAPLPHAFIRSMYFTSISEHRDRLGTLLKAMHQDKRVSLSTIRQAQELARGVLEPYLHHPAAMQKFTLDTMGHGGKLFLSDMKKSKSAIPIYIFPFEQDWLELKLANASDTLVG